MLQTNRTGSVTNGLLHSFSYHAPLHDGGGRMLKDARHRRPELLRRHRLEVPAQLGPWRRSRWLKSPERIGKTDREHGQSLDFRRQRPDNFNAGDVQQLKQPHPQIRDLSRHCITLAVADQGSPAPAGNFPCGEVSIQRYRRFPARPIPQARSHRFVRLLQAIC